MYQWTHNTKFTALLPSLMGIFEYQIVGRYNGINYLMLMRATHRYNCKRNAFITFFVHKR